VPQRCTQPLALGRMNFHIWGSLSKVRRFLPESATR
jgi:hypothetical protein